MVSRPACGALSFDRKKGPRKRGGYPSLGWRTDLSLDNVLEGTELQVARKQNVNPLRFWALVECVNCKDSEGVAHKKSAAYANGTTVFTPTPSSLSAGATNKEALA